jgi:hypothetical protein
MYTPLGADIFRHAPVNDVYRLPLPSLHHLRLPTDQNRWFHARPLMALSRVILLALVFLFGGKE